MTDQGPTDPPAQPASKAKTPRREDIDNTPGLARPLDYGRRSYEPKSLVVLPLLIGLIIGFVAVGLLGFGCLGFANGGTPSNRGAVVAVVVVLAVLIVALIIFTVRHVGTRPRDWSYWFVLGLTLGAGTTMLLEGLCFFAVALT